MLDNTEDANTVRARLLLAALCVLETLSKHRQTVKLDHLMCSNLSSVNCVKAVAVLPVAV